MPSMSTETGGYAVINPPDRQFDCVFGYNSHVMVPITSLARTVVLPARQLAPSQTLKLSLRASRFS